tara:strand:+ start:163 stop:450 length:288 start_codon:yes stop_codon:yes gene_type:complete
MKKELNIKIYDKHSSKWWESDKNITWAVQRGDDWWLIKNDKIDAPTDKNSYTPSKTLKKEGGSSNLKFYAICFGACTLGVSLAIGLCTLLITVLL